MIDLSIIIPLWNEEKNITPLVESLSGSKFINTEKKIVEVVLVNNGSTDKSENVIEQLILKNGDWLQSINLDKNLNYGGGIYAGFLKSKGEYICFIPGDLQYSVSDLDNVINKFFHLSENEKKNTIVKGKRILRYDSKMIRFVSRVYTEITNFILGLNVKDINGLPKLFHRSLLEIDVKERMQTFVFDAQLLFIAKQNNWIIDEIDVIFYDRRSGVSSWSNKRIKVYIKSIIQLLRIRFNF